MTPGANGKMLSVPRERNSYPVMLSLKYRMSSVSTGGADEVCQTGSGRTVEMSSSGILFEADEELVESPFAELSIVWPASLSQSVGLTLRVRGRIASLNRNRAVLMIAHHEFVTRRLLLVNVTEMAQQRESPRTVSSAA